MEREETLERYLDLLTEKNKTMNLIRFKTREELWKRHIMDAMLPFEYYNYSLTGKVADIGSGGGLPAIPLAIAFPGARFDLIESISKKADFLKETAVNLGLTNIFVSDSRVEDFALNNREEFDFVTARALAPLKICLEYAAPLLKVGAKALFFKGPALFNEYNDATRAMKALYFDKGDFLNYSYELEDETYISYLAEFIKRKKTPGKFPRNIGKAKKRPL